MESPKPCFSLVPQNAQSFVDHVFITQLNLLPLHGLISVRSHWIKDITWYKVGWQGHLLNSISIRFDIRPLIFSSGANQTIKPHFEYHIAFFFSTNFLIKTRKPTNQLAVVLYVTRNHAIITYVCFPLLKYKRYFVKITWGIIR